MRPMRPHHFRRNSASPTSTFFPTLLVRSIEETRLMRENNWSLPLALKRLENASSTFGRLGIRSGLRSIRDCDGGSIPRLKRCYPSALL
jgi:hypothetical protein